MDSQAPIHERDAEDNPPYPTYETVLKEKLWTADHPDAVENLDWTLNGPLETAVFVKTPTPQDPKAHTSLHDPATGEWHPFADMSVCFPRIRSVTVCVRILSDRERTWDEIHYEHSEQDDPEPMNDAIWGYLEKYGSRKKLLSCCGTDRPMEEVDTITVRAAAATSDQDDDKFVTVRDYVTVVHPWLMGLRGKVMDAMHEFVDLFDPLPVEEYPLIVIGTALHRLRVEQDRPPLD